MKLLNMMKWNTVAVVIAMAGFLASCNKSADVISADDSASASNESADDSYHSDVDDISSAASAQSDATLSGRVAKWNDNRLCDGTVITLRKKVADNPDTLMIDFGTSGCTDAKGNVRKGKIVITYASAKRWALSSSYTVSTDNYSINDVKVEGTRTVTNLSSSLDGDITFEITLAGGKLTFTDGTTATREAHHYRQWARNGTPLDLTDDAVKILASYNGGTSTASGSNRHGATYIMQVTSDLTWKASCLASKIFIPVAGTKELSVSKNSNTVQITVDYGDGNCDKEVTLTVNNKSKTVTLSRDSNG
ncbi:MAG: hypothetical protein K1X47_03810 [Cyclobacteriaceae bacterium]|nr:hypothetical protein [Cyclobacteriaceae bacterium]